MLASNYWLADYTKLVLAIIVVAMHTKRAGEAGCGVC